MACYYTPGFHQGSTKNTLLAATKLRPTPAVFKETKNTLTFGFEQNYEIILALYFCGVLPSILTYEKWFFCKSFYIKSSIPKN